METREHLGGDFRSPVVNGEATPKELGEEGQEEIRR